MLSAVAICAAITFALRAAPFAVIEPLRSSRLIRQLAGWMPAGLMLILLVYLLRDVPRQPAAQGILAVAALALSIGLHWWRGNALLSIFAGTAVYVAVLNLAIR
jgi:branched-subunit amino acid transport protein AzlD